MANSMERMKKPSDWIESQDQATSGASVQTVKTKLRISSRKRTHSETNTADTHVEDHSTISEMFEPPKKRSKTMENFKWNSDGELGVEIAIKTNVHNAESEEESEEELSVELTVIAEVHAEADFDPGEPKPFDVETPESLLKPKFKRTTDPKLDINRVYRIKNDVDWKIIANDWEKYRIVDENPNPEPVELIAPKMVKSVAVNIKSLSSKKSVDGKSGLKQRWTEQKEEMKISDKKQRRAYRDREWIKSDKKSSTETYVDQELKRQGRKRSIFSSESDDGLKNDENQENREKQTAHPSNKSIRTTGNKTDSNQNVLQVLNKNVPIQRSPKPKAILQSNPNDALEMIARGSNYENGQLISRSHSS